jgi:DNA-binding NarL/FixJ family response regulator
MERTGLDEVQIAATQQGEQDGSPDLTEVLAVVRNQLSVRQQRVLDGLLEGKPRAQIAAELKISERTIYYEIREIRRIFANHL